MHDHDSASHDASITIRLLRESEERTLALAETRRTQRDTLRRAILHAFDTFIDPRSTAEEKARAIFAARDATRF